MAGTKIIPCKCENAFQDKKYGKGLRVHNIDSTGKKASCTVCEGSARNARRTSKTNPPTTNRSFKNI